MGNLGGEFGAIVQLERGRDSKVGNDLQKKEVREWLTLLLVVGKVSSKTKRYLTLTVSMWVSASCQSVPGREPLAE